MSIRLAYAESNLRSASISMASVNEVESILDDKYSFSGTNISGNTWSWVGEDGEPQKLKAIGEASSHLLHSLKMYAFRDGSFFTNPTLKHSFEFVNGGAISMKASGTEAQDVLNAVLKV